MVVLAAKTALGGGHAGRVRRSHLLALTGALLIQLALLGPIIWMGLGGNPVVRDFVEAPDGWLLPLDLTPRLPRTAPEASAAPGEAVRPAPPSMVETAPAPHRATPQSVESAAAPDPRWRVAPQGNAADRPAWGGEVCRDISNIRAWMAANCRENGPPPRAELRGSPPAEIARPEPRRGRPPGATGAEEFAAQAAANEAWREYTRGDGAYPGLRSLARHH